MSSLTLSSVLAPPRPLAFTLSLRFLDAPIRVFANDAEVCLALRRYYAPWVVDEVDADAPTVTLLQGTLDPGP